MLSRLNSEELNRIETITLGHYDANAESFWEGTKDHDVTQNREAFLSVCIQGKSLDILDLGCGPGRDITRFKALGHRPTGWTAVRSFAGSLVITPIARSFNKPFLIWNCRKKDSMGFSPTPRCFIFLVRNCPAS